MVEKITSRHIFHKVGPFCKIAVLPLFKLSQMRYAGYVNVARGESQTGRVKLNISASEGKVTFPLVEGKKSTGFGFTVSVTQAQGNQ